MTPTTAPATRARHFLNLPDAATVPVPALDAVAQAVQHSLADQSILCIYGDAGCGKTFALRTALETAPHGVQVLHLTPRPAATPTALRTELLHAAHITPPPTHDPGVLDAALRTQLTTGPHFLALDDASRLTTTCIDYLSYLVDDPTTQLNLVLLTATPGIRTLRRHQLLTSRTTWLPIQQLTPDQVREAIPWLHPLWRDANGALLDRLDAHHGHGNFRRWAQLTHHALRLQQRPPPTAPDELEHLLSTCLPPQEDPR